VTIVVRGMCPLIQVFDMPASVRFYRDVLGFEIVQTSAPSEQFDWAQLKLGGATLMLNTAYEENSRPSTPDPLRMVGHTDTGLFFECPDVDATYRYLKERGVHAPEPKDAAHGMRQLYISDPDGYVLCFQWPTDKR
jgi:glyoxylase I family protein